MSHAPNPDAVHRLTDDQWRAFAEAVEHAAQRDDVRQAVAKLYLAVQDAVAAQGPVCSALGRCCRFDECGHRLFVTTMEVAAFMADLRQVGGSTKLTVGADCPFQQGRLCSVHGIRPMGCRLFFCDDDTKQWQEQQYARFHAELKRLHGELGVLYYYIEWRGAISCCFGAKTLTQRGVGG